jgi:SAM-dependent methyltransferase
MDRVKRFYDSNPDMEWGRLFQDTYHKIEYEVTSHFIHKYASPQNRIVDIGCGPGRYAIQLLEEGYHVTLVDLSSALLEKAQKEIEQRQLTNHLEGIYEKNAIDLDGIKSNTFDVALLLGPLYHLPAFHDRKKAIKEALRVTKPGGYIFAATITRLSPIRDMFRWKPADARQCLQEQEKEINQILETGVYINETDDPKKFTDAYLARPQDIPNLYTELQIQLLETFSCEGIAAFLDEKVNQLIDNEETWKRLFEIIIRTCTDPSILGAGEHCVFVGQKQKT